MRRNVRLDAQKTRINKKHAIVGFGEKVQIVQSKILEGKFF